MIIGEVHDFYLKIFAYKNNLSAYFDFNPILLNGRASEARPLQKRL